MGQLRFCEEEQEVIVIENFFFEVDKLKEKHSLVGKIHADWIIGKEILKIAMGKIWRLSKPAIFIEVG